MLKVLAASFDYDEVIIDDWISYFCFELDFGRKYSLDEECLGKKTALNGSAEEAGLLI